MLLAGLALNWFAFGIDPAVTSLPSAGVLSALVVSAILLVVNHTWLMTSTELTRLKYGLKATPEEWVASETRREDISKEGWRELERRHNAHRNATENSVYFVILAMIFSVVSPTVTAAQAWIIGFAVARLGYTFSYLSGWDDIRGVFMSLSLIAMYGMVSYLLISLFV
jgi:uncharacterized MAPEG superfamily protein